MRRRSRQDAMQPDDAPTWLVVEDQYGKPIYIEDLPSGTDPRMVMISAMSRSIREGWEVEELPGTIPIYFCRKDGERRMVTIVRRHPDDKLQRSRPEPWDGVRETNVTPLKRT
jgi:hypothetical protein